MKSSKTFVLILALLNSIACSVADNQNCNTEKLLVNAADGDMDMIETCYKSGANILISDKDGKAIYTVALENGYIRLAIKLQEIQLVEWESDNSPLEAQSLYDAIEYNNVVMIRKFIENDFDITAKHINGVAPVVFAVFNESNDALGLLLNNGVDVGYEFDFRPLICIASMFNQQETVRILLEHGADVNDMDGSGVTTLMFAAKDGYYDLTKFLLDKGADTSAKDIQDDTALDLAKANSHEEVVTLLEKY